MTTFTESQMAAFAWVYVASRSRKRDTKIEPGDFARIVAAQLPPPEATPSPWVCCEKKNIRPGSEL